VELFSCLLLLLTATVEPDTIWITDFSGMPSGWEADLHWSSTGSMRLILNSQVQNVFDFDHSSLNTDYLMYLPDTDSLILIVEYSWTGWGAYTGGINRDGAFSRSRINVHFGNVFNTLWDSIAGYLWFDEAPNGDAVTHAEIGPYSSTSQGTLTLKLPDIPDYQWFRIEFRGDTGGFQDPSLKGGQYAYIDWHLQSATLLSYRSGTTD
jgi:hypothetical protein